MYAGRWREIAGNTRIAGARRIDDGQRVRVTEEEGEKRSSELRE